MGRDSSSTSTSSATSSSSSSVTTPVAESGTTATGTTTTTLQESSNVNVSSHQDQQRRRRRRHSAHPPLSVTSTPLRRVSVVAPPQVSFVPELYSFSFRGRCKFQEEHVLPKSRMYNINSNNNNNSHTTTTTASSTATASPQRVSACHGIASHLKFLDTVPHGHDPMEWFVAAARHDYEEEDDDDDDDDEDDDYHFHPHRNHQQHTAAVPLAIAQVQNEDDLLRTFDHRVVPLSEEADDDNNNNNSTVDRATLPAEADASEIDRVTTNAEEPPPLQDKVWRKWQLTGDMDMFLLVLRKEYSGEKYEVEQTHRSPLSTLRHDSLGRWHGMDSKSFVVLGASPQLKTGFESREVGIQQDRTVKMLMEKSFKLYGVLDVTINAPKEQRVYELGDRSRFEDAAKSLFPESEDHPLFNVNNTHTTSDNRELDHWNYLFYFWNKVWHNAKDHARILHSNLADEFVPRWYHTSRRMMEEMSHLAEKAALTMGRIISNKVFPKDKE